MRLYVTLVCLLFSSMIPMSAWGQIVITGTVLDSSDNPIEAVSVAVKGLPSGTTTNLNGRFAITLSTSDTVTLQFRHVAYSTNEVKVHRYTQMPLMVVLSEKNTFLEPIQVTGSDRREAGLQTISAQSFIESPSGNNDISAILKSLPGVVSNNELSANYSVRGGNFDENLVFINDIPVYKPFLISNGRQEGLGTVNPDLLSSLEFHSGGWSALYGGKLSSVLLANYRKPSNNNLQFTAGLLGGDLSFDFKKGKLGVLAGARLKSSQYLLNTLDTQGEYQPRFADTQLILNYDLSDNTELQAFFNFAANRFLVVPSSQVTEFGTFNQSFRLFVAFEGKELMNYNTLQGALKLTHRVKDNWRIKTVVSRVQTTEEEITDREGGYRLCDIDRRSATGEDCIVTRGIGTEYRYARNQLDADLTDLRIISDHQVGLSNNLTWGVEFRHALIDDLVDEYAFIDSSDYVTQLERFDVENNLSYTTIAAFISNQKDWGQNTLSYGLRLTRPSQTDELLWSPRISYNGQLSPSTIVQVAAGIYHQPPFFREFRERDGNTLSDVRSQSSAHIIAGLVRDFKIWDRPFEWRAEGYFKGLWNSIPYDIENVRIRYLPNLISNGRVMGVDSRLGGEFIPGTESWFSLGILSAKEDIKEDNKGLIRKPTDQRLTLGILFRDYFPNNPTMRVTMNLQVGTGLPFGPPGDLSNRNVFTMRPYRRLDMGFTKEFEPSFGNLFLSIEILNVLGVDNVITYNWITDIVNQQIAVPNALSGRFFNFKLRVSL